MPYTKTPRSKLEACVLGTATSLVPVHRLKGEALAIRAVRFIRENLSDIRAVSQVGEALGVSREHLSRSFKKHLECSVWEFITALRVERAKELLRSSKLVKETAKEVGFGSDASLARAFMKHVGILPADYKRKASEPSPRRYPSASSEPQARPGG